MNLFRLFMLLLISVFPISPVFLFFAPQLALIITLIFVFLVLLFINLGLEYHLTRQLTELEKPVSGFDHLLAVPKSNWHPDDPRQRIPIRFFHDPLPKILIAHPWIGTSGIWLSDGLFEQFKTDEIRSLLLDSFDDYLSGESRWAACGAMLSFPFFMFLPASFSKQFLRFAAQKQSTTIHPIRLFWFYILISWVQIIWTIFCSRWIRHQRKRTQNNALGHSLDFSILRDFQEDPALFPLFFSRPIQLGMFFFL